MIGRNSQDQNGGQSSDQTQSSFDDFDLRLGDLMRGERATMGKSLLDVQRELRIKASYISAIENCDPDAFDTPGFIAGYVRSYARYLGMDPDETFGMFCQESGFAVAHGMSSEASVVRKPNSRASRSDETTPKANRPRNPLSEPNLPFAPARESWVSRIEPGAVGSSLVLLALIGGIGYGGWSVLQEVQRVHVTPVDQTPVVLSELDPLDSAVAGAAELDSDALASAGVFTPPTSQAFDRIYRPQALDVPVLVARDAPISSLDPSSVGVFAQSTDRALPHVQDSSAAAVALAQGLAVAPSGPDALPGAGNVTQGVSLVAARKAWVEVKDGSGAVLISRILEPGDIVDVPGDADAPRMIVGESGALYFNVAGMVYGPAGKSGVTTSDISLVASDLTERYVPADAGRDTDLVTAMVAHGLQNGGAAAPAVVAAAPVAAAPAVAPAVNVASAAVRAPVQPKVVADPVPGITVVATAETWVEVTAPSGKKLFAQTLQAGQTYQVPQTEQPPVIFSGNAGGVYFAVNGETYGPYGQSGKFGRNLALSPSAITQQLAVADLTTNVTLAKTVAALNLGE